MTTLVSLVAVLLRLPQITKSDEEPGCRGELCITVPQLGPFFSEHSTSGNALETRLFLIRAYGAGDIRDVCASTTLRLIPRQGLLALA